MANNAPAPALSKVMSQSKANTIILVGDSLTARNWRNLATGLALSVSGTTCTCTLTSHAMYTGMVFRYVDRGQSGLMGTYTVASYIDANNFTFTVPAGTPASPTVDTNQGSAVIYSARKGDDGFFNYANSILNQRLTEINNFGVGGDHTTHVLARMSEILASPASRANLLIGTNDARNALSVASYSTNLLNIVTQLLNSGKLVDICTIPPIVASPAVGTIASANQLVLGYNAYIKTLARSDPRIMLHDIYEAITDCTATTATVLSGMLASDNVHFSPKGAYTAGAVIAANFANRLPVSSGRISSMSDCYNVDSTNSQLLTNPLMQGTGGTLSGGATGSVPTNWTVTMTSATSVVASIVSRADGIGNDLQGVLTASSSSSRMRFDSESLISRIVAGATYFVEGDIFIDSASVIGTMKFELQTVTNSGSVAVLYLGVSDVGNGNMSAAGVMQTFRSNNFVLPVSLGTAGVRLDIFASGVGTVTARLGRVQLRKVS